MHFILALFLTAIFATNCEKVWQPDPQQFYCHPHKLEPYLWQERFGASYGFDGFHSADGTVYAYDANGSPTLVLNMTGSVYYQYFDEEGQLWSEIWINGIPGVPSGTLVLGSTGTIHPIPGSNKACQIFYPPSSKVLIDAYSEINPKGVGYMTSTYYSQNLGSYKEVVANEFFSWDSTFTSALSEINYFSLGKGHSNHYINTRGKFKYVPITLKKAIALGYTGKVHTYPSAKSFNIGRASVPVEIFTEEGRNILGV